MPLPAQCCRPVQAIDKTVKAKGLSLRGGRRPTWQSREDTADSYRASIITHKPIASVAALTAQPLAALPPYGCGVPFTGGERLVGVIQRQQGTGAPRHSLTCHCEATKWPWQSRSARLNHWKTFGENANRFTGTVSVKMYLTFLARVDIIKMWKPGRLPQHMCFWICEVYYSQINEPSVAADGSLFTISEPVDDLANQPEDRKYPEHVLKCYMYHLLRDISRRGYTCLPPFRSCGMTGNRL